MAHIYDRMRLENNVHPLNPPGSPSQNYKKEPRRGLAPELGNMWPTSEKVYGYFNVISEEYTANICGKCGRYLEKCMAHIRGIMRPTFVVY